ncbi:MAG TPA: DNA-binding response regulator [Streptomyces sp.]
MAAITTLHGDLELRSRLVPLASLDEEFVSVAPDFDTWPGARENALRQALGGGAERTRKLFGPAVLADAQDRRLLEELAARGTAVRIARTPLPQGTVFVGRRTMVLTAPDARRTYLMSTEPALVESAFALFEAVWRGATDLAVFLAGRPRIDERAQPVLDTLGSGLTDEAAARKLGMSLRTYRRRVADLLVALDAESRFQAGVRAGEWGLSRG